jgi:hypothetical protein
MSSARTRLIALLLALGLAATAPDAIADGDRSPVRPAVAHSTAKLLAHKWLTAARGGTLRAPNGVKLRVPARVMQADGLATITRVTRHVYDFHVSAPWTGRVAVTLPRRAGARRIAHRIGGMWIREFPTPGTRTVRLSSLSRIGWLDKVKALPCIRRFRKPMDVVRCLKSGGFQLSTEILQGIVEAFTPDGCEQNRYYAGFATMTLNVPLPQEVRCVGQGGDAPAAPQAPATAGPPVPVGTSPDGPVQGAAPLPASPEPLPPIQQPAPQTAQPQPRGFRIADSFLGGTWARTDPNNGTWYSRGNRPPNGAYWYPNGLGVGVDCARAAAAYSVTFAGGRTETWNTWFHVTDGKWFPSAAAQETSVNGFYGLPGC